MTYEINETKNLDGKVVKFVTVFIDESNAKTFPADKSNFDFVAFITANPDVKI